MAGVKPTLIFAGAHKVDGHPYGPLPATVKADLRAEIDDFYRMFVECVAAGRRQLSAKAIRDTEAATFMGTAAVAAGLADEIGSFEGALADLEAGRITKTTLQAAPATSQGSRTAGASTSAQAGALDWAAIVDAQNAKAAKLPGMVIPAGAAAAPTGSIMEEAVARHNATHAGWPGFHIPESGR